MTGPIGRAGAVGGVGPLRDAEREGAREGTRAAAREGGAQEVGDRVTISPEALRGARSGSEESASGGRGEAGAGAGDETSALGASGFRNVGEALLVARGLANALRQEPGRAAHVHDLVSPARALALLRA
jgi:hypothetical protein